MPLLPPAVAALPPPLASSPYTAPRRPASVASDGELPSTPPSACSQTRMERDTEITFRPQAVGSQRSAKCHWLAEFKNGNPFGCLELRMAYRSLEKASPASTACAGACHVLFAQAAGHDGYVDVSERASLEALAATHARGRAACAWPPLANEAVCWKSATNAKW